MASETLQLGETKSGGGEAVKASVAAALRTGRYFTGTCACVKEYLGTKSFPSTTDVTNSLEYSMASSLHKQDETKVSECVNGT